MSSRRRLTLVPGIYDEVVSARVEAQLAQLAPHLAADQEEVKGRASLAAPLAAMLRDALDAALDEHDEAPDQALALATELLATLQRHTPRALGRADELALRPSRLLAIVERPATAVQRPLGSLHRSQLIVNAAGEQLLDHLRSEFDSADRIDLLCAFVKLSGLEKLWAMIERHCVARGRLLRVLTTTYMGASDQKAIERLAGLRNVELKVSYDDQNTRLHAKAWLFHRVSGVSTAYVGSSNLSHAAQTEGLEWNVRVAEPEQPALIEQIRETFGQYWDHYDFEPFDPRIQPQRERLARALAGGMRGGDVPDDVLLELEPKPFQRQALDELTAARHLGRHRNLLVAATGTGKTVMAALDYAALRAAGTVDTLLYVAHRREILEQAVRIFRAALQLRGFGEQLHQYARPSIGRHVFASIDSLGEGSPIDPAAFDMVILDEAHHAAARTWDALLERVRPVELLGLTGTPERADGLDYERHFPRPWVGNLRLWNAIPHALVPFRYYMLDVEGADLRDVKWVRGRYVEEDLARTLIDAADVFVRRAMRALADHVGRPADIRAIAFCCDGRHAGEIARRFTAEGYRCEVLTERTPPELRRAARRELDAGRVQILCVVDLYNEGVDVPNVNTLFFFRPTESATVFLQQLGRGLRRTRDKAELVVFDLTGRQHLEFRFDRRLRAAFGHSPRQLRELVEHQRGHLPSGCHLHLDELAREEVLAQLRRAVPADLRGIRTLLREPSHVDLDLHGFLRETEVDAADLYAKGRSWSELRREVGLETRDVDDLERGALGNVHKLLHAGDATRLTMWERLLDLAPARDELERRTAAMLFGVLYGKQVTAAEGWKRWRAHAVLRDELRGLLPVLRERNPILAEAHELEPANPLRLHGRYLGVELSAAFDQRTRDGDLRDFYTGVEKVAAGRFDLLLVTLDKRAAVKAHLRYRDFPLNAERFHWQSKSRTTRDSGEGQRLLAPAAMGCTPLLFVREREDDRPGVTAAFQYLGPVAPERDEGERPITIEWTLRFPMPPELVLRGRVAA